jgi:hypothetical protein
VVIAPLVVESIAFAARAVLAAFLIRAALLKTTAWRPFSYDVSAFLPRHGVSPALVASVTIALCCLEFTVGVALVTQLGVEAAQCATV